jgi:hypothetical protein
VRVEKAIESLEELKEQATAPQVMAGGEQLTAWKGKVRGLLVAALGPQDHLIDRFDAVRYHLGVWSTSTPDHYFDSARHGGIRDACGVIDAALFQLRLQIDEDESVDVRSYDPELWEHVKQLVADGDWAKVASQTAIFVENAIRTWTGDPQGSNGEPLVGKGLMARVFSDVSDWRLGRRTGEREGWRTIAIGFTQALSNVDRHRIQVRDDARRYAIGVLGVGSLLLTQLRHEHGDLIEDVRTGADHRQHE